MMGEPVLVGDVGGTNVRFALAVRRGEAFTLERFEVLAGKDFPTFEAALAHYIGETGAVADAACFAFAGPVRDEKVVLTNRGWQVSAPGLRSKFPFRQMKIINDFHAMARSVPEHAVSTFETIFAGTPHADAPVLVTGPGTGLGVATLLRDSAGRWIVLSGEGGHLAYAPRTDLERDLARILIRDHGYVSNELVASGSGLNSVHTAFCEIYGRPLEPVAPGDMRLRADAGDEMYLALIETRALAVMGAAGDLVLANGALGGVVLAGGVSERIADFMSTPSARERFVSRGPMSSYLEDCPVWLMHDPMAPLIGAAAHFEQVSQSG
ncbi:glucokinase [Hyphomonas sp.]|uniref:glucokinase n=1 Tax=Hyphomonas sp. TaxID=87 RepID=UPI00391CFB71